VFTPQALKNPSLPSFLSLPLFPLFSSSERSPMLEDTHRSFVPLLPFLPQRWVRRARTNMQRMPNHPHFLFFLPLSCRESSRRGRRLFFPFFLASMSPTHTLVPPLCCFFLLFSFLLSFPRRREKEEIAGVFLSSFFSPFSSVERQPAGNAGFPFPFFFFAANTSADETRTRSSSSFFPFLFSFFFSSPPDRSAVAQSPAFFFPPLSFCSGQTPTRRSGFSAACATSVARFFSGDSVSSFPFAFFFFSSPGPRRLSGGEETSLFLCSLSLFSLPPFLFLLKKKLLVKVRMDKDEAAELFLFPSSFFPFLLLSFFSFIAC